MKAVVVYESLWGNTAAIARAIAEGIGPEARVLSTSKASPAALAGAGLLVAGAPVIAFALPSDGSRESIAANPGKAPSPPDLSHPSMRLWIDQLHAGHGCSAAFETRLRFSPGGSTSTILRGLERAGYPRIAPGRRFIVRGACGPLREGETERARRWGAELARAMG